MPQRIRSNNCYFIEVDTAATGARRWGRRQIPGMVCTIGHNTSFLISLKVEYSKPDCFLNFALFVQNNEISVARNQHQWLDFTVTNNKLLEEITSGWLFTLCSCKKQWENQEHFLIDIFSCKLHISLLLVLDYLGDIPLELHVVITNWLPRLLLIPIDPDSWDSCVLGCTTVGFFSIKSWLLAGPSLQTNGPV